MKREISLILDYSVAHPFLSGGDMNPSNFPVHTFSGDDYIDTTLQHQPLEASSFLIPINAATYADAKLSNDRSPTAQGTTEASKLTSQINEAEDSSDSDSEELAAVAATPVKLGKRPPHEAPLAFPQKLMEILSNPDYNNMISWLPHGNGFKIHDKKSFTTEVMPKYFKKSKFTSFTRKLNRWNFARISRGPESGAYYNPHFQQGNSKLAVQVTCLASTAPQNLLSLSTYASGLGHGIIDSASNLYEIPGTDSTQAGNTVENQCNVSNTSQTRSEQQPQKQLQQHEQQRSQQQQEQLQQQASINIMMQQLQQQQANQQTLQTQLQNQGQGQAMESYQMGNQHLSSGQESQPQYFVMQPQQTTYQQSPDNLANTLNQHQQYSTMVVSQNPHLSAINAGLTMQVQAQQQQMSFLQNQNSHLVSQQQAHETQKQELVFLRDQNNQLMSQQRTQKSHQDQLDFLMNQNLLMQDLHKQQMTLMKDEKASHQQVQESQQTQIDALQKHNDDSVDDKATHLQVQAKQQR